MPSCQQVRYSHSGSQMTPNTRGRRLALLVGPQRGGGLGAGRRLTQVWRSAGSLVVLADLADRLGGAFMPMDVSDEMSVVFGLSRAASLAAFQVICQ